jgi:hypothetical protein
VNEGKMLKEVLVDLKVICALLKLMVGMYTRSVFPHAFTYDFLSLFIGIGSVTFLA